MRNNYADRDAEPKFANSGATPITGSVAVDIEAASADEFWCVDWLTISSSGPCIWKLFLGSTLIWIAEKHGSNQFEHIVFNPGLYRGVKNEKLRIEGSGSGDHTYSIRYR